MRQFNCVACGKCCMNIEGVESEKEREFANEWGFGKLPMIQLVPVEESTFPLWDFEAKRFREYAVREGIDAKIRPLRGVFDLDRELLIIVCYQMHAKACPFLSGKLCRIYDTPRAFVCNSFPINRSPLIEKSRQMFGRCESLEQVQGQIDYSRKDLPTQIHGIFGKALLSAIQHDFMLDWTSRIILELMKQKKVRPAIRYPYEKLLLRIAHAKKIDLMDFLEEELIGKEKAALLIDRFESRMDARELLEKKYINGGAQCSIDDNCGGDAKA